MKSKKSKIKNMVKAAAFGTTCCALIYGSLVASVLKSFVKSKKEQYNKYNDIIFH